MIFLRLASLAKVIELEFDPKKPRMRLVCKYICVECKKKTYMPSAFAVRVWTILSFKLSSVM
jgi:hypothetical protein